MHTVLRRLGSVAPLNRRGDRLRNLDAGLAVPAQREPMIQKRAYVCVATFRDVHDAVASEMDRVRWVTSSPAPRSGPAE